MLTEKPWRGEKVFQLCLMLFVCFCFTIVTAGALHEFGVKGFQKDSEFGFIVAGTVGLQGSAAVLILIFLCQHHVKWTDAFGFRGPAPMRAVAWGIGIWILAVPGARLLQIASVVALEWLGLEPSVQTAVAFLENAGSTWMCVYLGVFAIVVAPVAEEFIFRGVLYPFVKRLGFPRLAWWGVSALFALIHVDMATFLPLFALALALTWLYERTDNLLAPITVHSLFNAANFAMFFLSDPATRSPAQK